jgi:hypothetical protein
MAETGFEMKTDVPEELMCEPTVMTSPTSADTLMFFEI